jgi:hypothetical protein
VITRELFREPFRRHLLIGMTNETMNKENVVAAILLGIVLAVCVSHFIQYRSLLAGKWAFATISSFVGFCIAIARIIEGRL